MCGTWPWQSGRGAATGDGRREARSHRGKGETVQVMGARGITPPDISAFASCRTPSESKRDQQDIMRASPSNPTYSNST